MKRLIGAFIAGAIAAYTAACFIWPWLLKFSVLAAYCFFVPHCMS